MPDDPPWVLIVEDEPAVASLYERWVPDDWPTTTVADVESAIDVADGSHDLVILDRRLPEQDGRTALDHLRAAGSGAQVVMVTAVEPGFDIIELGIDDYLVKPVDRDTFRDCLRRLHDRADYDEQLREYYALVSKLAVLEARKPRDELVASVEYERLRDRVEAAGQQAAEARESAIDRGDVGLFEEVLGASRAPGS